MKALCVALLLTASVQAEKKQEPFRPAAIETYASKQTNQGLTVAAVAYDDADEAKAAFGKVNPYEHGILPVLLLFKNEGKKTLNLELARFQYFVPGSRKLDETPAEDLARLKGPSRPRYNPTPLPTTIPGMKRNKNPLQNPVIIERAFSAKMLPPGESAYGFVYFQTGHTRTAKLYITGITEAQTSQELFYVEVPLGAK
ncbi:MAG: hypothetical protein NTV52_31750 [Acidobacteria bacterium]|nr:hypothetical protein [Acidobacteriota bacterium]